MSVVGQKINWKKALWDRLSSTQLKRKLAALPDKVQYDLFRALNFEDQELREIGWRKICANCHKAYDACDCLSMMWTAWQPPRGSFK